MNEIRHQTWWKVKTYRPAGEYRTPIAALLREGREQRAGQQGTCVILSSSTLTLGRCDCG